MPALAPVQSWCGCCLQVRAFAKEDAMLGRYEGAQGQTLTYGLRSAKLDGAFMSLNSSLATGK